MSSNRIAKKKKTSVSLVNPIIPYERPKDKELKKGDCVNLKCHVVPADTNSNTYEIHVPYFGTGSPEEWLIFLDRLWKGITGQNASTGPARFEQCERSLKGDALMVYRLKVADINARTNAEFENVLSSMTEHIFPVHAYREQKRYMRYNLKKPTDVCVRDFVSRVQELNSYLAKFPAEAPNVGAVSLGEDEVKDIIFRALPHSWKKQMTLQGFNYPAQDIVEMVRFSERIESMEQESELAAKTASSNKKKSRKSSKKKVTFESSGEEEEEESSEDEKPRKKYCKIHGLCSHTTDQCRDLKEMLSKHRKKKAKGYKDSKKSKYKYNKHELNAFFKKNLKKALKGKKKKKEELQAVDSIKMDISDQSSKSSSSSAQSVSSSSLSSMSS